MSFRYMRIIVMFDLPVVTKRDRVNYFNFRKHLLLQGFFMMQESIYCKMVLNESAKNNVILAIQKIKPNKGLVQVLSVTEKQFQKMEYLVGKTKSEVIDSDERLIIY